MADWDRYRRLEEGEVIQNGDEVDICNDGWRDEPQWVPVTRTVGERAPCPDYPSHRVYRRLKVIDALLTENQQLRELLKRKIEPTSELRAKIQAWGEGITAMRQENIQLQAENQQAWQDRMEHEYGLPDGGFRCAGCGQEIPAGQVHQVGAPPYGVPCCKQCADEAYEQMNELGY